MNGAIQKRMQKKRNSFSIQKTESPLDLASRSIYRTQKIMSTPEYVIFQKLKQILGQEYYIFPQVALSKVLASDQGYSAIDAKNIDLLLVDFAGYAVAAIEFKGSAKEGYFQEETVERDAIKYITLKKAGVKYISMSATDDLYLQQQLEKAGLIIVNQEVA